MHSRMVQVGGYRLHLLEAGSGPAVLLLHGFAGSSDDWRAGIARIASAGYHVLAPDCLGFGRSEKPGDAPYSLELISDLYAELLDRLMISDVRVIAHSMGAKYALALALRHPSRVARLTLIAADGFTPADPLSQVGALPLIGAAILRLVANPLLIRSMLSSAFYAPQQYVTPALIERGRLALAGADNRRALLALSRRYGATDLQQSGLRARLHELRVPSLLCWGSDDRVFPDQCARAAAHEIPHAQLVWFPRCGHFPQIEAERALYGLVLGFLAAEARPNEQTR